MEWKGRAGRGWGLTSKTTACTRPVSPSVEEYSAATASGRKNCTLEKRMYDLPLLMPFATVPHSSTACPGPSVQNPIPQSQSEWAYRGGSVRLANRVQLDEDVVHCFSYQGPC